MISSFSYKEDNTIAVEAVVNLLKYLNNMLDMAVAHSRMPSGHNPLNQLVLIIADGRFHEKKNLRQRERCIEQKEDGCIYSSRYPPRIHHGNDATFEGDRLFFRKYLESGFIPVSMLIVLKHFHAHLLIC